MITIQKVNKYFNKRKKNQIHVINDTTLKLEKTGLVALLGPSGSGKTTLLNVVGGLDKVDNGKIFIDDQKLTRKSVNKIDRIRNLNIGYIFQDYKLVDDMSVFDNIALVLKMIGIKDKKEIKLRVNYVLETLNIYRYRNRPASMLSGGERQRVGIARAIVKDPNIIIADEPTGNLDSKNTLEIMNIIKSISKNRLVILVTHESELAKFYASRIIELQDGKVTADYKNDNKGELDYRLENNIYLKDFKGYTNVNKENINVEFYSDGKEMIDLDIVVRNGNFYIRSNTTEKIEIIDSNSGIELIDDHYKKIDKSVYQKYEFNFNEVINKNINKKYTSILNIFTLVINGFKKVMDYSFVKKILLLGFFASSMFILLSLSILFGALKIEDKSFVEYNKNYLQIVMKNLKVDDYLSYESAEGVDYLLPGSSRVDFYIKYNDYYQVQTEDRISGSLSSINMITEADLIYGRMPENEYELVIDKLSIKKHFDNQVAKQIGISSAEQLLNREIYVNTLKNFKIVGVTDLESPVIYVDNNQFINIISCAKASGGGMYQDFRGNVAYEKIDSYDGMDQVQLVDYNAVQDNIKLKKGLWPTNDYEVVVNYSNKDMMPLKKTIDTKINGKKLKVVGYYTTENSETYYLVNPNSLKYSVIETSENIIVSSSNKDQALATFRDMGLNINDLYENSKLKYKEDIHDSIVSTIIVSAVIIAISLVEIFLMIRSSFLSRIKEIGIYRAIGVKKSDIYKMFQGEIISITTIACFTGIALMTYILSVIVQIEYLSSSYVINGYLVGLTIIICLVFNLIVGLIPVFNTLRKTPAQILARHDLD